MAWIAKFLPTLLPVGFGDKSPARSAFQFQNPIEVRRALGRVMNTSWCVDPGQRPVVPHFVEYGRHGVARHR